MAKLTEAQRDEIWRLWQDRKNNPISLRRIGERYGVSDVTAGAVIKKRREEAEISEGG